MTFFNFTKNVYLNHLPVIIDDATQTWPAMKELTVKSLFEVSGFFCCCLKLFVRLSLAFYPRSRSF